MLEIEADVDDFVEEEVTELIERLEAFADELLKDVDEEAIDEVDANVVVEDDDEAADTESTAQTPILQLPPHSWFLSPEHFAEQSVSGTLALFEAALRSFAQ